MVLFELYVDYFNLEGRPDINLAARCYLPDIEDAEVLVLSAFVRDFLNRMISRESVTQIIDFKFTYSCFSILARVE